MQVGNLVLGLTGGSGVGNRLALGDRRPFADAQCAEVRERRLVAVTRHDRHREAVGRHLSRERHLAGGWRDHRSGLAERDVDPSMLTRGVRVGADGELPEDHAVRRPRPRPRR
jgi:hypothetical protein